MTSAKISNVEVGTTISEDGYEGTFTQAMSQNAGQTIQIAPIGNSQYWYTGSDGFVYHRAWLEVLWNLKSESPMFDGGNWYNS